MSFKERLVELRKEKNLTQEDFAKQMGFSRTTISAWEIGRNEPSNIETVRMADFFSVSTDYLLGKSNDKTLNFDQRIKRIERFIKENYENEILIDTNGLTPEDIKDIKEYVEFKKEQRKKN